MLHCVNALKGATLISTENGTEFLKMKSCVNALKGATLISTKIPVTNSYTKLVCVNALKGATLISTLASGNPHE